MTAENEYADAALSAISHRVHRIERQLAELAGQDNPGVEFPAAGGTWRLENTPGDELPRIEKLSPAPRLSFDPNSAAAGISAPGIEALRISPRGDRVAVLISTSDTGASRLMVLAATSDHDHPALELARGAIVAFDWAPGGESVWLVTQDRARFSLCRANPPEVPLWCAASYTAPQTGASLYRTSDNHFLILRLASAVSSISYAVREGSAPAALFGEKPAPLAWADHGSSGWLIRSADGAPDFKILRAGGRDATPETVLAEAPGRQLVTHFAVADLLVTVERRAGTDTLAVRNSSGEVLHTLGFPPEAYEIEALPPQGEEIPLVLHTPLNPPLRYQFGARTGVLRLMISHAASTRTRFSESRREAPADDGAKSPLLLYRKNDSPGPRPVVLFSYGAYGKQNSLRFSPVKRALVERGATVALCEPRGGGFLGAAWHTDAIGAEHALTLGDLAACARYLTSQGIAAPGKMVVWGRSAGGLFAAAVSRRYPELFAGAVLDAPLLDPRGAIERTPREMLPPLEIAEWGVPQLPGVDEAFKNYSPMENLELGNRVPTLITAGLEDSLTGVAEAAPWVYSLRQAALQAPLLFRITADSTHAGPRSEPEARHEDAVRVGFALGVLEGEQF